MYVVRFSSTRVVEHSDPVSFDLRTKKWLSIREGENAYLIAEIQKLATNRSPTVRMFTLEEDQNLLAAGALLSGGCVCMTWAGQEQIEALADHAANHGWRIVSVCAPHHVAWSFGKAFAQRTGQLPQFDRSERVYQLTTPTYALPVDGRLEAVTAADKQLARRWIADFVREAHFEAAGLTFDQVTDALVDPRQLYFWKVPHAVAMAAWVAPTPNGASINFVYTPPEFRGKGHAKAVTAALGSQMLASGLKYCFIFTDTDDPCTNHIYQGVGARTICEILRCSIVPQTAAPAKAAPVFSMRQASFV